MAHWTDRLNGRRRTAEAEALDDSDEALRERLLSALRTNGFDEGNPFQNSFRSAFQRKPTAPTFGAPRQGSMEVRTGELEGMAPPPFESRSQPDENAVPPSGRISSFLDAFKRRQTPGFAGGTLEEQIARQTTGTVLPNAKSPYDDYTPGQGPQLETLELRPGQLTGRQRWEQSIPSDRINRSQTPQRIEPSVYRGPFPPPGDGPVPGLPNYDPSQAPEIELYRQPRQPMDERLPDGRTVDDLLRQGREPMPETGFDPTSRKTTAKPRWPWEEGFSEMDALARDRELGRRVGPGMLGPVTPQQQQAAAQGGQTRPRTVNPFGQRAAVPAIPRNQDPGPGPDNATWKREINAAGDEEWNAAPLGGSFKDAFTRKRPVPAEMQGEPFGESGEAFGSTRPRRTQPRDYIADDEAYLRDVENQPRSKKEKLIQVLDIISEQGFGNKARTTQTPRERNIARTQGRLGRELSSGRIKSQIESDRAEIQDRRAKAPSGSTRVIEEGEYADLPAGTEIRQIWDPRRREMIDHIGSNGRPLISKARAAERELAPEIKYDAKNHAVLVPKDGSPARPIFNHDGTPLTKSANESGNVQTAIQLEPDGITQIQLERNDKGEWVESVGPGGRRIVRGNVGRIDRESGAPMSSIVTAGRITEQERRQNQRKSQAYTQEEQEWLGKETNFRENKGNEDRAIQTKTRELLTLDQEKPADFWNRGGRTQGAIEADIERVKKEIQIHRENSKRFQEEADKAAASATEARRNRSLYNDPGSQGTGNQRTPTRRAAKAPAADGKYHYTRAEIEAAARAQGKDPDAAVKALRGRKDVVID